MSPLISIEIPKDLAEWLLRLVKQQKPSKQLTDAAYAIQEAIDSDDS
jgi:hypothetical protein